MPSSQPSSIRTHLLAIILLGAILPLAIIGFWNTQSTVRSGRALLDDQLQKSLANISHTIAIKWEDRRATLLLLAENQVTRDAFARGSFSPSDSQFLASGAGGLGAQFASVVYRDSAKRELFATARPEFHGSRADSQRYAGHGTFHFTDSVRSGSRLLGFLDAEVLLDGVLPSDSARLLLPGTSFAVRDHRRGTDLISLVGATPFPTSGDALIAGAPWMMRTVFLEDPSLEIAVGGPIAPYVAPFARDGRISLAALIVVALIAGALAVFFTTRLSRTINTLVDTTGAVADGDLSRRVETAGPAELQRLAGSFNAMTDSLRTLISEMSERRALAAVGEFAAALAHEVRNALTAIQIDLERVDERTEDAKNRTLIDRTLVHVRRLDAAVTGSLRIARSGRVEPTDVIIADLLDDTAQIAEPSFVAAGAQLISGACDRALMVRGDAEALHQLVLNLLLNAQQALASGGEAGYSVSRGGACAVIAIVDSGRGMTSEQLDRAFDPYYTTRSKGTGLGLPIARQIAAAHGGTLTIESVPGRGTRVEVRLPLTASDAPSASAPAGRLPEREAAAS
jgi:signal transduction histidine kinase